MAEGDVANVGIWGDADVAIADVGSALPVDPAAYGVAWDYLGLLDGSSGMSEDQSNDKTDFSAWGRGIFATKRKNVGVTRQITVLEENATTLGLRYDASGLATADDATSGVLKARDPNRRFLLGFDLLNPDADELERWITKSYAQIDTIGTITHSEDGIGSFPVTFAIYPSSAKEFWRYYKGPGS